MTIRTTGNSRSYQFRPSDHLAAERGWRHGPLQPMPTERKPSVWARIFRRVGA